MAVSGSSNPFGKWSSSSFGGTGNPFGSSVFGNTSTPAFASASNSGTSPFDQKPACEGFVASSSHEGFGIGFPPPQAALGSHPFYSTMTAFGTSNQPAFGVTSIPAFGSSPIPSFISTGTSSGAFSPPAFGASTSTCFEFVRTTDNGQPYPIFGANLRSLARNPTFGTTPTSQLGAGNRTTAAQPTAPGFSSTLFHESALQRQDAGSRFTPYKVAIEADGGKSPGKIHSISAIPAYKQKSHEELRWEDYQLGDKGRNSAGQSNSLNTDRTPFQFSNLNFSIPAPSSIASAPKTLDYDSSGLHLFVGPSTSRTIEAPSRSVWPSSLGTGLFSMNGFKSTTCSSLTSSSSPLFHSSQFSPSSTLTTPVLGGTFVPENPSGRTHSSGLFRSPISSPSVTLGFPVSCFSHVGSSSSTLETPVLVPTFVSSSSVESALLSGTFPPQEPILGKSIDVSDASTPDFKTSFPVNGSTLFLGNTAPSLMSKSEPITSSQTVPSMFSGFQPLIPAQTSAATGCHGTCMQVSGETIFQHHGTQSETVASQIPVKDPFGTLPTTPTIFIDRNTGKVPTIQYGIATMPVIEKPVQLRKTSLLTPRHVPQRSRNRMQSRRYNSKSDSPKVSFFNGCEEELCNPNANAIFIPRENPRALFIQQSDQSPSINNAKNKHPLTKIMEKCWTPEVDTIDGQPSLESSFAQEHQSTTDTWPSADTDNAALYNSPLPSKSVDKFTSKSFARQNLSLDEPNPKGSGYVSISRNIDGEAAITYMHATDIEALMPKLWHSDYYTEPTIQELAVKESAEPDYCCRVKDFVVGRRGYGSVKFLGETDVRCLELESIIQFNKCEIRVYMDESKKPHVGKGLNKSAEISLLNVKCKDKKTGQEFLEGPEVENFEKG